MWPIRISYLSGFCFALGFASDQRKNIHKAILPQYYYLEQMGKKKKKKVQLYVLYWLLWVFFSLYSSLNKTYLQTKVHI